MADLQKKSANIEDCYSLEQSTAQGLKFTIGNQTVYVNGTSTGNYPQIYINGRNSRTNLEAGKTYTGAVYAYNIPESSTVYVRIQGYDGSDWTKIQDIVYGTPVTFTMPTDGYSDYRLFLICRGTGITYRSMSVRLMINEGSQPLPYEPYSATGWLHSLRKLTTATEAVENPLYSDGTPITAYTIKGNMIQSGTPTSASPIFPSECGDRTENLFDKDNASTLNAYPSNGTIATVNTGKSIYIPCKPSTTYTVVKMVTARFSVYLTDTTPNIGTEYTTVQYNNEGTKITITTGANTQYLCAFIYNSSIDTMTFDEVLATVMIVEGSTAPSSYIPYGYKLPIVCGGVTTPYYLSEPIRKIGTYTDVASDTAVTRVIKKYVFTGQETMSNFVQTTDQQNYCAVYRYADIGWTDILDFNISMANIEYPVFVSSHFKEKTTGRENYQNIHDSECGANDTSGMNRYIIFCVAGITTANDFKIWLAQQYANGTPVTVWYILNTPTTESVTAPSIPTTEGANSITVDTTVQPSEFTATWTGWHDSSVKEYDGSDWN